jgi:hypothetical protein
MPDKAGDIIGHFSFQAGVFQKFSTLYHAPEHGSPLPLRPCNPVLANRLRSVVMPTYPSPFEYLIVFGLVFAAGVLTSVGLRQYINKVRREAISHA